MSTEDARNKCFEAYLALLLRRIEVTGESGKQLPNEAISPEWRSLLAAVSGEFNRFDVFDEVHDLLKKFNK
jgi:hypothetical protein